MQDMTSHQSEVASGTACWLYNHADRSSMLLMYEVASL